MAFPPRSSLVRASSALFLRPLRRPSATPTGDTPLRRNEDRDQDVAPRPGPYESPYQVLRGYDSPAPGQPRTPDRGPVLIAGPRSGPRLA
jgi:hypothetical protein